MNKVYSIKLVNICTDIIYIHAPIIQTSCLFFISGIYKQMEKYSIWFNN